MRIAGVEVEAVEVNHTIDTCAFLVRGPKGTVAYSGDTGPTERLWQRLSSEPELRALLMEVSFPNERHALAKASGHHTPESLASDLAKLDGHRELPILLYHIKPVFEREVEKQLGALNGRNLEICRLGDQYLL
jgi:ribonuclease BN (tRNA processing enzyme)